MECAVRTEVVNAAAERDVAALRELVAFAKTTFTKSAPSTDAATLYTQEAFVGDTAEKNNADDRVVHYSLKKMTMQET
ncbi:hypothetical protein PC128_g3355 [Phytophthora cactorum]|nr:hypothetical protein PC128_g3355 [Phytophthora cactorum]